MEFNIVNYYNLYYIFDSVTSTDFSKRHDRLLRHLHLLRSLTSLFSCVLLCVCDCVCVQGLALHQGMRLVDPEAGDFKRAALPAHEELTLAFAVVA